MCSIQTVFRPVGGWATSTLIVRGGDLKELITPPMALPSRTRPGVYGITACVMFGLATLVTVVGSPRVVSAAELAGSLSVESVPAGATVYVDGRFVGQTPIEVTNPPAGDHRVRLVKAEFLEHSRGVTVPARNAGLLQVRLTKRAAQNATAALTAGLKTVVIAGEDAVNVIQQETAVASVVEVRDGNDQPVAGAVVRFAIQGGRATFNGARALTVTTNVAGRAAVTGLTPTGAGAFQISAAAAFQGQTAVVAIAQTNVIPPPRRPRQSAPVGLAAALVLARALEARRGGGAGGLRRRSASWLAARSPRKKSSLAAAR